MRLKLEDMGPCAKQTTIAVIAKDGKYWVGVNSCVNPQESCPRGDMPSGRGYELCDDICKQTGHAETNAIKAAGKKNCKDAILYLFGHDRVCNDCALAALKAGIKKLFIVNEEAISPYFNWLRGAEYAGRR